MTPRVVVVGSLNYDLVTSVKCVPRGGETVKAAGFATHRGGKGSNQALALRRLVPKDAAEVAMVGCVGRDAFGPELLGGLKDEGVNVENVAELDDVRTGVATILVEETGENRILVYGGANEQVLVSRFPDSVWSDAEFVVLQNEIPLETTLHVLRTAAQQKGGPRTVLNPSPLPDLALSEWPHIDVLVVNEGEASALTSLPVSNEQEAMKALPVLHQTASLCVITLGARGVVYLDENGSGYVKASRVDKVVDTTGAGDTFLAAFVSQLLDSQKTMEERLQFAARAAGIAVTRAGAASSVPTLEEVQRAA